MGNIVLRPLYDQKTREFNVQGAGLRRFEEDFIDATNRAINRINREADLDDAITRIDNLDDTVDLDEQYEDVLSDVVSLFLHYMGARPQKGAESLVPLLERRVVDGIASIYTQLVNDRQDADSTDDIIGIDGME